MSERVAVTGAFGYTGKYITRRLLEQGYEVITLTGHPNRPDPFDGRVRAFPFHFDDEDALTDTLRGVTALYNTYWVRFNYGTTTFERAVRNTKTLLRAAETAGVRRIVHTSITNPSLDSPLPYFRGKAELEESIRASRLSYAILRPTVLFGAEDILINNIAFLLRRAPFFVIPGKGDYRLQPIFVDDFAALAVEAGAQSENITADAVGPETFTFEGLVRLIAEKIGRPARLVHLPPRLTLWTARLLSALVGDVLLTREELDGLMSNLLVSSEPPRGKTRLSDWLEANREKVGVRYASELARHYR
ncbi:MAG: NAD-dependent epimerase/dehydratase family protein [Anaerolineae bacterium]|nr:MAG: NAD-dependent epimerase/dehydratase family protein [Anaerolineae bacterium]